MHRAIERGQPLVVEDEDVGGIPQWGQEDIHEHGGVGIHQHEVMLVIRLQVAKGDERRLIAVDREHWGREGIGFAELLDRCLRPGPLDRERLRQEPMSGGQ